MTAVLNHPLFSHPWFVPVALIAGLILLFPLLVGYVVLIERKVLADFQVRLGPMRVGPHGLMQPLADALKLLLKEDIIPAQADKAIFWLAPVLSMVTGFVSFAVVPFSEKLYVADVNVGILVISALGSVGILGLILGGWSSNSHYPLLGALRSAAQLVSYEVALSLALVSGVMVAGSLSMVTIVKEQEARGVWFVFSNYGLMAIAFLIYLIAGTAETNRTPFDLPDAESELVAGFHTEYSGFRWGLFMLAEYANLFIISSVAVTLFWGGWLRPFPNVQWLQALNYVVPFAIFAGSGVMCFPMAARLKYPVHVVALRIVGVVCIALGVLFLLPALNAAVIGFFWYFIKVSTFIYIFVWLRGTFPRFRYDQLMDVGWKFLIPTALGVLFLNAIAGML